MAKYQDGGHYEVEIVNHAFGETSNGNPKVEFSCKVINKVLDYGTPHQAVVPAESNPYAVNVNTVFATEKQRAFNVKKLRHAGWNGASFDDFDMIGIRCICLNTVQSGTGANAGKEYDNFDFAMPPLEGKELESKPGMKKKLNALLSKELRDNPPTVTAPVSKPQTVTVSVPFVDPGNFTGDDADPF
jgi:hypothetical protein